MKKQLLIFTLSTLLYSFCSGQGVELPVTFENTTPNYYNLIDFGGTYSEIIVDPANPANHVAKTVKTALAETWAGTTVGGTVGFVSPVPFSTSSTCMTVRVWSPAAGTPVRLKVEDASNPAISVETQVLTVVAAAWDTLTFNFGNQVPGTAPLNLANTYDKASIFFNFGITGAAAGELTFYWDDMTFIEGSPGPALDLPVTFEIQTMNYGLTDFGGTYSELITDPNNPTNHIAKTVKTASAETWAGTTVGGVVGFANPVPFSPGKTTMSVKVWSPAIGMPVRLKVEAANDPTISVETEANTTMASAWETLVFDFSNQAPGTAALNFANSYNKASIFFNFGTSGSAAGELTFFWDDMYFGVYSGLPDVDPTPSELSVYPNPAGNELYLKTANRAIDAAIYTPAGTCIKTLGTVQQPVNVNDLKTGLYVIRVTGTNGKTSTATFIKK